PCSCPLAFQRQVRRLTSRMSSESYPGYPECVVSCHGAGGLANKQPPQNTRRNELPVKLIDGSLVMRHEYVAGAPVELMQIRQTASSADGVLHHPPEPFNG